MRHALLVLYLAYYPFIAQAADAPAHAARYPEAFIQTYYMHPDPAGISQAMDDFAASGAADKAESGSPAIAFFSMVFVKNPGMQADWQKHIDTLEPHARSYLQLAMTNSRHPDWVLRMPFHSPTSNDMYWGAFFATGDSAYVLKLVDTLRFCDERVDLNLYTTAASAQWSLAGNIPRHPYVRYVLEQVQKKATGAMLQHITEALTLTPNQLEEQMDETFKVGKASGSWKPSTVTWKYEVTDAIIQEKDITGKAANVPNLIVVDYFLDTIGTHAAEWPPVFASETERADMSDTLQQLLENLDLLISDTGTADANVMKRVAYGYTLEYNLDIPGAPPKISTYYGELLAKTPDDPELNYQYGKYMAATDLQTQSIPYLEKAAKLGEKKANYMLGFVYATRQERDKALPYLQEYSADYPDDQKAKQLIAALKNSDIKIDPQP